MVRVFRTIIVGLIEIGLGIIGWYLGPPIRFLGTILGIIGFFTIATGLGTRLREWMGLD